MCTESKWHPKVTGIFFSFVTVIYFSFCISGMRQVSVLSQVKNKSKWHNFFVGVLVMLVLLLSRELIWSTKERRVHRKNCNYKTLMSSAIIIIVRYCCCMTRWHATFFFNVTLLHNCRRIEYNNIMWKHIVETKIPWFTTFKNIILNHSQVSGA